VAYLPSPGLLQAREMLSDSIQEPGYLKGEDYVKEDAIIGFDGFLLYCFVNGFASCPNAIPCF
jgi:hypothetical protein